jgi:RNA polymerase sigma-70 factor, ECF subfamily
MMLEREITTLVHAAREGDRRAFSTLVRLTERAVRNHVISRTRDPDWADDLAQETYIAAYLALGNLRDPARFEPWLHGIADRLTSLWMRRTMRRREFIVTCDDPESNGSHQKGPADHEDGRNKDVLSEKAAFLPPRAAQALALYYGCRLTQKECAAFLGISAKAFESRLMRARDQLRKEAINMTNDDIRDVMEENPFDHRIQEEIDKLVAIVGGPFRKDPVDAAEERLHLLFARNEARLTDLIAQASTQTQVVAAARMTLSLRGAGIARALSLALSDDETTRCRALAAIPWQFEGNWTEGTHQYLVLDAIEDADYTLEQKVRLLVDLVRRPTLLKCVLPKRDLESMGAESSYYMERLLGYTDLAINCLVTTLGNSASMGHSPDRWIVRALALFGTDGAKAAMVLSEGDEAHRLAALTVVQMLGEAQRFLWVHVASRGYGSSGWRHVEDRDVPVMNRVYGKTFVVQPSRVDDSSIRQLAERIAQAIKDPVPAVRMLAVEALGYYPDDVALSVLVHTTKSKDERLAVIATRALGTEPSANRVEPLVTALEDGPIAVRAEAHNSLVRLVSDYARHIQELRNKNTAHLLPCMHDALPRLEALLSAVSERVDRIETARGDAMNDSSLSKKRRSALSGRGVWDHLLPSLLRDALGDERSHRRRPVTPRMEELSQRARAYHEAHPEVTAMYKVPTPVFDVDLGASMRELPEDRRYTDREMKAATLRINNRHDVALRRLFEEWWMERDGREYWFTERGRTAWRMEHLLAECALSG